ncbi:hypothetical protein BRPE64_ACDS09660 [Caballeronia insecticola]|uniref:Uncharacterized protein n=1 Tax=Caballeronia insecticola TaxID=758793 RepID=R4WPB6_9BURK|nr:hypothetical protein BRPE64_ACDS09660 [Caballeronia insecticola]
MIAIAPQQIGETNSQNRAKDRQNPPSDCRERKVCERTVARYLRAPSN